MATTKHIDIDSILRQRAPKYYKVIPRFAIRWLERTVHQDELNEIYNEIGDAKGVEAADIALRHLGINIICHNEDNIPTEGRFIFASNHPLGGLDGMALISTIGHRYNGEIRFLVNDLLMAIKPLDNIFLPINKYGRQSRLAAEEITRQYESNRQMLTFPAGLCSRKMDNGTIHDLTWQKNFVAQAIKHQRDIIPVFVEAHNSNSFYRLARWREKFGIKFNIEMIYLPDEMFRLRGKTLNIHFGKPITWQSLNQHNIKHEAIQICNQVYNLKSTS